MGIVNMRQKEKVILFGRGMVYQQKKERLYRDYAVVLILDNAVKEGAVDIVDEETGVRVMNPIDMSDTSQYSDTPIILLSYALGDMYQQLCKLGISKERILFGTMLEPYNTFERMLFGEGGELILKGEKIFYQNRRRNLFIKIDPSNLEKLMDNLKGTSLYQKSENIVKNLPLIPLDDTYGMRRGTPIDRYYIERFLDAHKKYIQGTVMEIGDREYTNRFGMGRIENSIILHVEKEIMENNQIKGNFATGEGLEEDSIDCLICTQTLPFIYDVYTAADNIVKILKKDGTALITVAGISQIIQYEKLHYGHYWSFTEQSLERLFENNKDIASVDVITYGNVKTSTAFLYGISYEELEKKDLDYQDPNYQLIVAAVVRKK